MLVTISVAHECVPFVDPISADIQGMSGEMGSAVNRYTHSQYCTCIYGITGWPPLARTAAILPDTA